MATHPPVWTLSTEQLYETLSTSAQGLSETETALRIKHYGFNELPEPSRRSLLLCFSDQLTHFMALLLWVAGTLAFISGTPELGWAIWAVTLPYLYPVRWADAPTHWLVDAEMMGNLYVYLNFNLNQWKHNNEIKTIPFGFVFSSFEHIRGLLFQYW